MIYTEYSKQIKHLISNILSIDDKDKSQKKDQFLKLRYILEIYKNISKISTE